MELNQQYDPWTDGWMLGKYEQHARFPAASEIDEWLEGFKLGCTEVCEFHIWRQRLGEYINGRVVPAHLLQVLLRSVTHAQRD